VATIASNAAYQYLRVPKVLEIANTPDFDSAARRVEANPDWLATATASPKKLSSSMPETRRRTGPHRHPALRRST
jgi:hypothetical protein